MTKKMTLHCISCSQVAHFILNETYIHTTKVAANRTFLLSACSVSVYLRVKWRGDEAVAHDWSTLQCFDICCCHFAGNLLLQAEECWSFNPAPPMKNLHLYVICMHMGMHVHTYAFSLSCSQSLPVTAGPIAARFTSLWQTGGARKLHPPHSCSSRGLFTLRKTTLDSLAAETGLWFKCEIMRLDDRRLCLMQLGFKNAGALNGNIPANLRADEPGCRLMRAGGIVWAPSYLAGAWHFLNWITD